MAKNPAWWLKPISLELVSLGFESYFIPYCNSWAKLLNPHELHLYNTDNYADLIVLCED